MQVIKNPVDIQLSPIIGLDLETSGLHPWEDYIKLITIATDEVIYILEPVNYSHEFLQFLFGEMRQCLVVAHNAKFDCGFIYNSYGVLVNTWWDTMLGSQIVTNGKDGIHDHSLTAVIQRYLNKTPEFAEEKSTLQKSFSLGYTFGDADKQLRYAADDVRHLIPLYNTINEKVTELELQQIIQLENRLIPILSKMEVEGCLIDSVSWSKIIKEKWVPKLDEIEKRLDIEYERLTNTAVKRNKFKAISYDLFGYHTEQVLCSPKAINYASQEQVVELFRLLEAPVPLGEDKENGGLKPSVDDPSLVAYCNEYPDTIMKDFIDVLREYRVQSKLISTYGEKFLAQLDKNSRIHTQYTQAYTKTGRLSSKSPNLQNIPASDASKPDNDVRKFFIARPGYKFITCDMSGAEIRIAADYSGDTFLINSILNDTDMHSDLASTTFSIILGEPITVNKSKAPIFVGGRSYTPADLRQTNKTVVFAKFYKAGAKKVYSTLAEYINPLYVGPQRLEIASRVSRALDNKMPQLSKYLSRLIDRAQKEGFLRTSRLGRIRYFNSDVYGEAANAPIQGTNAEAIKIAMVNCYNYFKNNFVDGRIVMNIHDELVCEVRDDEKLEDVAINIQRIMSDALGWFLTTLSGGASMEINTYWKKD